MTKKTIKLSMCANHYVATCDGVSGTGTTRAAALCALGENARIYVHDHEIVGPDPVVGMGATEIVGSDCYSWTVTAVLSPTRIELTSDIARGPLAIPGGGDEKAIATLRKDGKWRAQGCSTRTGRYYLIGERSSHYDPSF